MPASEAKADYPRHSSDFAGIDGYPRWVGSTLPAHAEEPPTQREMEPQMIILGVVLLVVGFVVGIPVLVTIGGILLVIGVILWILGTMGRAVGGRKHYY
jgi:hypothetical protein